MLIVWTLLLVLAVLGGSGEAQSCKRCMKGKGSNLAKGLPALQSSDYVHKFSGVAGKAVDGNCAGDWFRASCTHTNLDMEPWWYVDLGSDYAISTVVVKNREDCCSERLQGAQIHVGYTIADHGKHNSLCGTITDSSAGSISVLNCKGLEGSFVSIHIPSRREYLTLCEVEVYGTKLEEEC